MKRVTIDFAPGDFVRFVRGDADAVGEVDAVILNRGGYTTYRVVYWIDGVRKSVFVCGEEIKKSL